MQVILTRRRRMLIIITNFSQHTWSREKTVLIRTLNQRLLAQRDSLTSIWSQWLPLLLYYVIARAISLPHTKYLNDVSMNHGTMNKFVTLPQKANFWPFLLEYGTSKYTCFTVKEKHCWELYQCQVFVHIFCQ